MDPFYKVVTYHICISVRVLLLFCCVSFVVYVLFFHLSICDLSRW